MRQESVYKAADVVGSLSKLALEIGVSKQLMNHWARGISEVPVVHCVKIESISQGVVMRWDLRPNDWWQIWPELIAHPDAPVLSQDQLAANQLYGFKPNPTADSQVFREVNHG
jgi:DNA-binding transcriptional regulator YdaS (Cro superfamily)